MTYFMIKNSDGDTIVREVTKEDIKDLAREDAEFIDELNETDGRRWYSDTNYWGNKILIIKGEVVVPKVVEVVTRYEVP